MGEAAAAPAKYDQHTHILFEAYRLNICCGRKAIAYRTAQAW